MTAIHRQIPAGLLLVALSACTAGPDYRAPEAPLEQSFVHADAEAYSAAEPEVSWWQTLDDATLTQLVSDALAENHDIRIAVANVRAARAVLGESRLDRFPAVTAAGGITRHDGAAARPLEAGDDRATVYEAGFDALWELDFFGRVRRGVEAAEADYGAAIAERHDVAVTVAAEVARAYVELRGAQLRLEVARRNAANQQRSFELTQVLFDGGRGTRLDTVRARAQLETTLAGIAPLESEVQRQIHRLGVLVGEQPGSLRESLAGVDPIPALPAHIEIGDASGLMRRRADIRAAERRLAAQTARVGQATAQLYPQISISAVAGFLSMSANDFGSGDSRQTSIGPLISWPAFDFGRVRSQLRVETAQAEASLAMFEKTVLTAFEEAENSMVTYLRAQDRSERLRVAASASDEAVSLARIRFRNGVDSFLSVLDAERRLLEAQDALARAETESALSYVALYKALGGGWQES